MQRTLKARIVLDRHGQPLVVLEELPGCDPEYYPAALRQLARQFTALANAADQGDRGPISYTLQE